jgi:S1-C subfamily serine protease
MKQDHLLTVLATCLVCLITTQNASAQPLESVVKVFTVASTPVYALPWVDYPVEATGSGCVIKGKRILTNAHVVSDQTMVFIRKQSSPDKFKARVVAVAHECDLALLTVEDESFFNDLKPLDIVPDLPQLQDPVFVLGYPEGGDTVSFTQGVVSRIEIISYVHSYNNFLALQIDAAINPGNSGGPVFSGEKLAGVVMQIIPGSQSIGYAVPSPIILRFLKDVEDNGKFDGFGWLNVQTESMENPALRASKQMKPGQSGVLVTKVSPAVTNVMPIRAGDVLLAFDGVDIANNGTVALRKGERVGWGFAMSRKLLGESCKVQVLRDGRLMELNSRLLPQFLAISRMFYDVKPSFYIHGGFVFSPLTANILGIWGANSPQSLTVEATERDMRTTDEQAVILINVLADDCNAGYGDLKALLLKKVNGQAVINMKDLITRIEANKEKFLTLEFERGIVAVLDTEQAKGAADLLPVGNQLWTRFIPLEGR